MRAHVVGPVSHGELIREAARLRVEAEEAYILGRTVISHLTEDHGAVYGSLVLQTTLRCAVV
jgi:hypothetical protein